MADYKGVDMDESIHQRLCAIENKPWITADLPGQQCFWPDCHDNSWANLALCFDHSAYVYGQISQMIDKKVEQVAAEPPPETPKMDSLVYYLMLSRTKVKIGTTTDLKHRISQLRSDLRHVVAVELGGIELERQRHQQFSADRIGRRENFYLSENLKAHIKSLQPHRNAIVTAATAPDSWFAAKAKGKRGRPPGWRESKQISYP